MVSTVGAVFPFRVGPLNNIQPFTYRDGTSHMQLLEKLRVYINGTMRLEFNAGLDSIIAEFNAGIAAQELEFNTAFADMVATINEAVMAINNRVGPEGIQRVTLTDNYVIDIDPTWPDAHPIMLQLTQDTVGGRVVSLGDSIEGDVVLNLTPGGVTTFWLVPNGGGVWTVKQDGYGGNAGAGDSAARPLIGLRVGAGSVNTIPDSQYFDELHNLEVVSGATADITNWYRGVGASSANDFVETVVPELKDNPDRKILYVLEIDKSNAQFNREMVEQDGIYPHLVDTLAAIRDSGYGDRVFLAPFHEGNGGGGDAGSIGSYDWHMYDTDTAQLVTPNPADWRTSQGTPYGPLVRVNTPDQYKTAFRNVVGLARDMGLTSKFVQWFLAANSGDSLTVDGIDRMDMSPGYAGDDYADIIGLSYYNRSGDIRYSATWTPPGANGLREFYNAFERISGRPLWLCESGCAASNEYGDKGQWYADLIKLVGSDEMPRIRAAILFMQDSRRYDVTNTLTGGMDMKLETVAQKRLVGNTINAVRRGTKVSAIPASGRNLLPRSVAALVSTSNWTATPGVGLTVGNQYTPNLDAGINGMRVTKPAFVSGDTKTSHNIYHRINKANFDYVPNDPYVMTFKARAAYDGFKVEVGIRQDGGLATSLGDELVLSNVWQDYVMPFASQSNDATLDSWRAPNFSFGNNRNQGETWFEFTEPVIARGTMPVPNVEKNSLPRVRPITNAVNLTWNCEAADIYTVTLGQGSTLMPPTGAPFDGQEVAFRITQDGVGSRALNLHATYYTSTGLVPIAAGPGAKTFIKFQYDASGGRWGVVGLHTWELI